MKDIKTLIRLLLVGVVLLLVACGGGTNDSEAPTAVPTLTDEERASFAPGLAQNPLQMVLHPVSAVQTETLALIASVTENDDITLASRLVDDLAVELETLGESIRERFGVSPELDAETVTTVADVVAAIYAALGNEVAVAILDQSSLYVDVVIVGRSADALQALCASQGGVVSIAWLDGVAYTAAQAQLCGDPALLVASEMMAGDVIEAVELPALATAPPAPTSDPDITPTASPTLTETPSPEPSVTPETDVEQTEVPEVTEAPTFDESDLPTGSPVLIVLSRGLGTGNIGAVQGRTFCRLGYDDLETWLLPSLLLSASGIDPLTDLASVEDYATMNLLMSAVAEGRCDAAGLTQDTLDALAPSLARNMRVAATSEAVPYGVLMYPLEVQLGVRLTLNELLIGLAVQPDGAGQSLRWLLGQSALVPVDVDSLAAFDVFMQTTNLDFEQLGN